MITPRKCLLAVVLLLLGLALLNGRYTRPVSRPVTKVIETIHRPADLLANALRTDPPTDNSPGPGFDGDDSALAELLDEERAWNDQLWQENQLLRDQIKKFEAIIETRDIKSIRMVEARVSRVNSDPVNPTMKVLRGTLHGLRPDDAVVYEANLLGFVTDDIGPANATVELINRPGFEVQINIMPPEGVRAGSGWPVTDRAEYDRKAEVFTCELEDTITRYLQKGDIVRVSDNLRESANGFVLGTIDSIVDHREIPLELDTVIIKPRTPIGPQRYVTVLTERDQ